MPHIQKAFDLFDRRIMYDVREAGCRSMLYVGWRQDTSDWWCTKFIERTCMIGAKIGILDIWEKNCDAAKRRFPCVDVIHGDIREISSDVRQHGYDLIFWDGGPEHVTNEELVVAHRAIEQHAGKLIIYDCPWGVWPQGPDDGNEAEIHHTVYPELLAELGMHVYRLGRCDQQNPENDPGELVAISHIGR